MSINWGSYDSSQRLGVQLSTNSSSPTATIWGEVWFEGYQIIDTTNTVSWSGDNSGSSSPGIRHSSSWSGTEQIASFSWTQDLIYGSEQSVSIDAQIGVLERCSSSYIYASDSLTLPARPYEIPYPPPSATVVKNSDTQHTVSWTTNYTGSSGGRPWDGVKVYRSTNGGSYSLVTTKPYTTTSWSDNTTVADRTYAYRVYSYNSSGPSSSSAQTGMTITTPAATNTPTAAKDASNNIVVSWAIASTIPGIRTEVYNSPDDGVTWSLLTTAANGVTSYTHLNPQVGGTHRYKLRAVYWNASNVVIANSVESAWSVGAQTIAPPYAPTFAYTTLLTVVVSLPLDVWWLHHPVDGTTQTSYELEYRERGTSPWTTTGEVVSYDIVHTFAAGTFNSSKIYEIQVRNKGQSTTFSPWSDIGLVIPVMTYANAIDFGLPSATPEVVVDGGTPNNSSFGGVSTTIGDTFVLDGVMFAEGSASTSYEDARLISIDMSAYPGSMVGTAAATRRAVIKQRLIDNLPAEMPVGTAYKLTINGATLT